MPRLGTGRRLLRPVIWAGLAGLLALGLMCAYVVHQFDAVSLQSERQITLQGYRNRLAEFAHAPLPYVVADGTARHMASAPDPAWIDRHLAAKMAREEGIDWLFVVDAQGRPFYAAHTGKRGDTTSMSPFAPLVTALTREVIARRGHPRAAGKPTQSLDLAVVDGQLMLASATPVRPETSAVSLPVDQAPIVVAVSRFDARMISKFGARHMVGGLAITTNLTPDGSHAYLPLADRRGKVVAALQWTPQRPGTMVIMRLRLPLALAALAFLAIGWAVVRQSAAIANNLIVSEARARHLALHDALTGMPNRALLFERLGQWQAIARRTGVDIAVHCLDLDRFKEVNDTLGHPAGDALIRAVSERLTGLCRETDTVARMGGDEFVILQPQSDASGASILAERVLAALAVPFDLDAGVVEIGCSIGVSLVRDPTVEAAEIIRQADLALYQSKEGGRNRITFFEPEMDAGLRMRRKLETDLRRAVAAGELHMVYQPQVDQSRQLVGMEALVRWDHPTRGAVPPNVFVPLAEECGLIAELGEFTFRRVFEETKGWHGAPVAINVSALQLRMPSFMAMVTQLVAEHGANPANYQIEITETVLLGDDGATRDNILVLAQEGFTIALDDFGTGYSSLSSLQRFAIDKIKIDRSFVRNLEETQGDGRNLVAAIVNLAHALNLAVIAEGVETEHQREQLIACGCEAFQGYLFGRPVPWADCMVHHAVANPAG